MRKGLYQKGNHDTAGKGGVRLPRGCGERGKEAISRFDDEGLNAVRKRVCHQVGRGAGGGGLKRK